MHAVLYSQGQQEEGEGGNRPHLRVPPGVEEHGAKGERLVAGRGGVEQLRLKDVLLRWERA